MSEQENPMIQITVDDIKEANQLSLHCPICANPVEANPTERALVPVVCAKCGTLYHKVCWEQAGGKCATLGCGHNKYYVHGRSAAPSLRVDKGDVIKVGDGRVVTARNKQLKSEQARQVEALRRPSLLQRLWQWLLDAIRIG